MKSFMKDLELQKRVGMAQTKFESYATPLLQDMIREAIVALNLTETEPANNYHDLLKQLDLVYDIIWYTFQTGSSLIDANGIVVTNERLGLMVDSIKDLKEQLRWICKTYSHLRDFFTQISL